MNDIILTRREQFRTEIRKQSLEKMFKLKRTFPILSTLQTQQNLNLNQFELNSTDQIKHQIQNILNKPTNTNIEKLIILIQELDIQNKINLVDKNVYELLKSPNLDLNLTLLLMNTLCSEPVIIKHIFLDQIQTDRIMQFLNYLYNKQQHLNIFMYWEFLCILSISSNTPFICLKQIYILCCKEVIESRNNTISFSAQTFSCIIEKNPVNLQFYWDTINQLDDEGRRPWKSILYFLKQSYVDENSCQYFLLTINYFIQYFSNNFEDQKFHQIVNPELISILQFNMYRHEKTLIISAQLFQSIFHKDNSYFSLIVNDLVKLLYNTTMEGLIEILKVFEILLTNEQIVKSTIRSQNIVEQLFNLLRSNILVAINDLALKCISNSITRCSNIQHFQIICNKQYRQTLEMYTLDVNKQLQDMAQQLLDFYFEY
ncbi:unnamed protein product [Paramecium sonneborni]|uniref:Uncharacterized protein n=1 Tax=Paramecium sonneborni TaxID=65129 RepID=A0A8S1NBC8_9CILI|nr:unnamed protein product [Paramecium sonneborni]